jgi:hypothetical protein
MKMKICCLQGPVNHARLLLDHTRWVTFNPLASELCIDLLETWTVGAINLVALNFTRRFCPYHNQQSFQVGPGGLAMSMRDFADEIG